MIAQVTPASAAQILNDKRLVIIWFSNDGCGPCRLVEPIIKQVALQRWPNIVIARADMDINGEFATQHDVKFVPTLLVFKNGQVVDKISGYSPEFRAKLVHSIATHI